MKLKTLWVVIMLTLFAAPLFSQGGCQYCIKCENGGCKCTYTGGCGCDSGPPCTYCGACAINCIVPCTAPVPPVEAAFRQWPWLTNIDLANQVGAVSPVLGKLVEAEQFKLATGKCPLSLVRGGSFSITDIHSKVGPWAEWHSLVDAKSGTIHYIVSKGYGTQPHELLIMKDRWQVVSKKKVVYEGTL